MEKSENRNKLYTVLVLCIGIVISVWLFERQPENASGSQNKPLAIIPYKNTEGNENTDWKKILINTDRQNNSVVNLTSVNDSSAFDETTLTAQMARDFFSQYLLAKKGGTPLTQAEINQITENTLASPQYKPVEVVYVLSNLKITNKIDKETVKKYRVDLNVVLKNRSSQIKENPITILNEALRTENPEKLHRLDPIITVGKNIVSDLLQIEVPRDVAPAHLAVVNVFSNLTGSLEAMQKVFIDPVGSFVSISNYAKQLINLQKAITGTNVYFLQKLGEGQ